MRHHHCSRRGSPSWQREFNQACCLSMIAMLLVPLLTEAHDTRRLLAAKPKLSAERCHQEITGCSICFEQKGAVAAGAQFPGMQGAPEAVSIVTCQRCRAPYVLNTANGNCDCGKNSGSAFANGTLIRVDLFEPAKKEPATLSDIFPPGSIDSTAGSSIKAESGSAMVMTAVEGAGPGAATTVSFSSVDGLDGDDSGIEKSPQRQQAALKRRLVSYLRNQGYDIQAGRGTLILSRLSRTTLFSADASAAGGGLEPSSSSEAPQALICILCKLNTASPGGMIGGSFCMPPGKN